MASAHFPLLKIDALIKSKKLCPNYQKIGLDDVDCQTVSNLVIKEFVFNLYLHLLNKVWTSQRGQWLCCLWFLLPWYEDDITCHIFVHVITKLLAFSTQKISLFYFDIFYYSRCSVSKASSDFTNTSFHRIVQCSSCILP